MCQAVFLFKIFKCYFPHYYYSAIYLGYSYLVSNCYYLIFTQNVSAFGIKASYLKSINVNFNWLFLACLCVVARQHLRISALQV